MMISIIVAADQNWVIGGDTGIPWHLPSDLIRFRRLTLGKPCIMGRTTHEHIGKPLDGRLNIVLSKRPGYQAPGCHVASKLTDAIKFAEATGAAETMVIGGEFVYHQALPMAHRVYLSEVVGRFKGDARFPVKMIEGGHWIARDVEHVLEDEKNRYSHRFSVLERA